MAGSAVVDLDAPAVTVVIDAPPAPADAPPVPAVAPPGRGAWDQVNSDQFHFTSSSSLEGADFISISSSQLHSMEAHASGGRNIVRFV